MESEVWRIDLNRPAVGVLCVLQRAHDHPPLIGSDIEHDFGLIWQEQIGAVTRRGDDQDIVCSGLHQIGDLAESVSRLVAHGQSKQLKEKELAWFQWPRVGAANPQRLSAQHLDRFGGGAVRKAQQGVMLVKAQPKQTARCRFLADEDLVDGLQVVRLIGGQPDLCLTPDAVRTDDRADGKANLIERRRGIGARRLDETLRAGD